MALRVSEIFLSIQGESTHAGRLCVFVRLAGCNLSCVYCDTEYAAKGAGSPLSVSQIMAKVELFGVKLVELTGGEPLSQPASAELIAAFADNGFEVLVETNGTVDIGHFDRRAKYIVDIKTPGSGQGGSFLVANYEKLKSSDEVKFVITSRMDFDWAVDIVRERGLAQKLTVLFSPADGFVTLKELAGWIIEDKTPARMNIQMHKVIWGQGARGV
ncbi:MAG: radical SAM protein [Nitrospinae bacterium]|nr:radical SAM protein [Nitrospinota bacterium]MBF0633591.1 radical SAM protein [Nitrospinota bacterium]